MSSSVIPHPLAMPCVQASHQPLQWVVLLHGLFATRRSMRRLENRLKEAGYQTINWHYPTFFRTAEDHVRRLRPLINHLQRDPQVAAIHFVTHSMGGILARYALQGEAIGKIQRFVMLAPPNRGSHLTRVSLGPFARVFPTIVDLSESGNSLPNRLVDSSRLEFGVIAAERDLVVTVSATHLAQQREHCTIDTNHFRLPYHDQAITKVLNFLATGSFATGQSPNPLTELPDGSCCSAHTRVAA